MTLNDNLECVLFDLDGTLLDTAPDFVAVVNELLLENNKDSIEHWKDFVLPILNADNNEIETISNAMNFFITELEYFDDMDQVEREETMGEDYDKTWNYVELKDRTIQFGHTHETDRDTARDEFELGPDAEIIDR